MGIFCQVQSRTSGRPSKYNREVQKPKRPTPISYDQLRPVTYTDDRKRPTCDSFTPGWSPTVRSSGGGFSLLDVAEALVGDVTEMLQRLLHLRTEALEVALLLRPCALSQSGHFRRELTNRIGDLLILAEGQ